MADDHEVTPPLRLKDTLVLALLTLVADLCLYTYPGGSGGAGILLATVLGLLVVARRRPGSVMLPIALLLTAAMLIWNASGWAALVAVVATLAFAVKLVRPEWKITEVMWTAPIAVLRAPFCLIEHIQRLFGSPAWPFTPGVVPFVSGRMRGRFRTCFSPSEPSGVCRCMSTTTA